MFPLLDTAASGKMFRLTLRALPQSCHLPANVLNKRMLRSPKQIRGRKREEINLGSPPFRMYSFKLILPGKVLGSKTGLETSGSS